jgi:hypothetical protein
MTEKSLLNNKKNNKVKTKPLVKRNCCKIIETQVNKVNNPFAQLHIFCTVWRFEYFRRGRNKQSSFTFWPNIPQIVAPSICAFATQFLKPNR